MYRLRSSPDPKSHPKLRIRIPKLCFYPIEIQAEIDTGCQKPSQTTLRPVIFVWMDSNMWQHNKLACPGAVPRPQTSTRNKTRINTRFETGHKTCPKTDPQTADQKVF